MDAINAAQAKADADAKSAADAKDAAAAAKKKAVRVRLHHRGKQYCLLAFQKLMLVDTGISSHVSCMTPSSLMVVGNCCTYAWPSATRQGFCSKQSHLPSAVCPCRCVNTDDEEEEDSDDDARTKKSKKKSRAAVEKEKANLAQQVADASKTHKTRWARINKFLFGWINTTYKINGKRLIPHNHILWRIMVRIPVSYICNNSITLLVNMPCRVGLLTCFAKPFTTG